MVKWPQKPTDVSEKVFIVKHFLFICERQMGTSLAKRLNSQIFQFPRTINRPIYRLLKDNICHEPITTNYNIHGKKIICVLDSIHTILSEEYF
jgi:hypothetical protein